MERSRGRGGQGDLLGSHLSHEWFVLRVGEWVEGSWKSGDRWESYTEGKRADRFLGTRERSESMKT